MWAHGKTFRRENCGKRVNGKCVKSYVGADEVVEIDGPSHVLPMPDKRRPHTRRSRPGFVCRRKRGCWPDNTREPLPGVWLLDLYLESAGNHVMVIGEGLLDMEVFHLRRRAYRLVIWAIAKR